MRQMRPLLKVVRPSTHLLTDPSVGRNRGRQKITPEDASIASPGTSSVASRYVTYIFLPSVLMLLILDTAVGRLRDPLSRCRMAPSTIVSVSCQPDVNISIFGMKAL